MPIGEKVNDPLAMYLCDMACTNLAGAGLSIPCGFGSRDCRRPALAAPAEERLLREPPSVNGPPPGTAGPASTASETLVEDAFGIAPAGHPPIPKIPSKPRHPMKQSILFLSIIVSAGSLLAREAIWVSTTDRTASICLGRATYREVGLTKLIATGTDLR